MKNSDSNEYLQISWSTEKTVNKETFQSAHPNIIEYFTNIPTKENLNNESLVEAWEKLDLRGMNDSQNEVKTVRMTNQEDNSYKNVLDNLRIELNELCRSFEDSMSESNSDSIPNTQQENIQIHEEEDVSDGYDENNNVITRLPQQQQQQIKMYNIQELKQNLNFANNLRCKAGLRPLSFHVYRSMMKHQIIRKEKQLSQFEPLDERPLKERLRKRNKIN